MRLAATELPGVLLVEPDLFSDDRGWFMETFSQPRWMAAWRELGQPLPRPFVQDNHSCSRRGVLRGLHYQLPPHPQGKLVRVARGASFHVALDLRQAAPGFGRSTGVLLSASNRRQLWIPEGFAHGFLALEDDTEVLYKATDIYAPATQRAIRWDDPTLGIRWPLPAGLAAPRLGARDAAAPLFAAAELPSA